MDVALGLLVAAVGLGAALANKRFGEVSVETTRSFFGRELSGTARSFMIAYSCGVAVVVGLGMAVFGVYFAFFA